MPEYKSVASAAIPESQNWQARIETPTRAPGIVSDFVVPMLRSLFGGFIVALGAVSAVWTLGQLWAYFAERTPPGPSFPLFLFGWAAGMGYIWFFHESHWTRDTINGIEDRIGIDLNGDGLNRNAGNRQLWS